MGIKHSFTSPKDDGTDATVVRPSNWNADHVITETSGPDTLDVGAIPDGSILARAGGAIVGVPESGYILADGSRAFTAKVEAADAGYGFAGNALIHVSRVGNELELKANAAILRVGANGQLYAPTTGGGSTRDLGLTGAANRWRNLFLGGALDHNGSTIGVFGTAPTTKQTVSGSRGGNEALESLLTALAAYGLITDSSS
jgi:hypothetical protein